MLNGFAKSVTFRTEGTTENWVGSFGRGEFHSLSDCLNLRFRRLSIDSENGVIFDNGEVRFNGVILSGLWGMKLV